MGSIYFIAILLIILYVRFTVKRDAQKAKQAQPQAAKNFIEREIHQIHKSHEPYQVAVDYTFEDEDEYQNNQAEVHHNQALAVEVAGQSAKNAYNLAENRTQEVKKKVTQNEALSFDLQNLNEAKRAFIYSEIMHRKY